MERRLGASAGGRPARTSHWRSDPQLHRVGERPRPESGFDPVLDRIQYLAHNGLTSLMVLHDFLSKRLTPLQDRSHHPAWMYTRVNDIMQLERRLGSSLDEALLVASMKALTTDPFSAELVVPVAVCESICANQAVRAVLLATIPTMDDVDIALVQRGDQSRGVVIPGPGGPGGAAGGRGRGGTSAGSSAAGSHSGAPALAGGGGVEVALLLAVPAPLAVLAPLWPLTRANRRASFLTTMRYRPMRTSLYRSGCGGFLALGQVLPRPMRRPRRRPWLTRSPRRRGPRREPWWIGPRRRPP
jgi:hypothetical protein